MLLHVSLVLLDGSSLLITSVSLVRMLLQDARLAMIRILVRLVTLLIIGNKLLMKKESVFVNLNITNKLISVSFVLIHSTSVNCAQSQLNVSSVMTLTTSTHSLETINVSASINGISMKIKSVKIALKPLLDA